MNLLFFIDRYPGFGGIETVTTLLSNCFVDKGYAISIVSLMQEDVELLDKLDKRVTLLSLPNCDLLSSENKEYLITEIKNRKIDFLIHQHSYAPIFSLIVKIKSCIECKIITVEHNTPDCHLKLYSNYFKETPYNRDWIFNVKKSIYPILLIKRRIEETIRHRYLYKYSDKYILLSEQFIPVFERVTHLKNCKKLAWIPNPLVNDKTPPVTNKENIILFVGRLDKVHKRVDRLIRIFEQVNQSFEDWKLLIVGNGSHKKELEEYVNLKQIDNVCFEGFQVDVSKYYQKAKIICLTSNIEGWPMILGEAMRFGVIPFSFDSYASVFDIIENGVNGFIIPAFKEDTYAKKLQILMLDKNLQESMSKNAAESSLRFSLDNVYSVWDKFLSEFK